MNILHGIRVIACVQVIMLHNYMFARSLVAPDDHPAITNIFDAPLLGRILLPNWVSGVDNFLFLSGFLCVHQLLRWEVHAGISTYARFLANRVLRLYPVYLPYMLVSFFVPFFEHCKSAGDFLQSAAFVANYHNQDTGSLSCFNLNCSGVGWTLSVDMQCYVITMLIFFLIGCIVKSKGSQLSWLVFMMTMMAMVSFFSLVGITVTMIGPHVKTINVGQGLSRWDAVGMRKFYEGLFNINPFEHLEGSDYPLYDPSERLIAARGLVDSFFVKWYFPTHTHSSGFWFGALLSALFALEKAKPSTKSTISGVSDALGLLFVPLWACGYIFPQYAMATGSLLNAPVCFFGWGYVLRSELKIFDWLLGNRVLIFLSGLTYAVYFVHIYPAIGLTAGVEYRKAVLEEVQGDWVTSWFSFLLSTFNVVAVSFVVAVPIHYLVENPCDSLRKRFISSGYTQPKAKEV